MLPLLALLTPEAPACLPCRDLRLVAWTSGWGLITALATATETALMTPNPDSDLDRDYSIKADFQMSHYLDILHQGPLRTT